MDNSNSNSKPRQVLLAASTQCRSFLPMLAPLLRGPKTTVVVGMPPELLAAQIKATKYDALILSDPILIAKLYKHGSQNDLAGSLATTQGVEGVPTLILNPLIQLATVAHAKFLFAKYISKLLSPKDWVVWPAQNPLFLITPGNIPWVVAKAKRAQLISIDIETKRQDLRIDCVSYSMYFPDSSIETYTLEISDRYSLLMAGELNATPAPKIMHNGSYDNSYFLRWGIPCANWIFDTQILFHCLYSELPKSLDSVSAFLLRDTFYWKNMALAATREGYLEYNAKDAYVTLLCFLQLCLEYKKPDLTYALENYKIAFPLGFPALKCGLQGLLVDEAKMVKIRDLKTAELGHIDDSLTRMTGGVGINSNSPKQVTAMLKILGCNPKGTDEKTLEALKHKHKFAALFIDKILDRRGLKKAIGTYFNQENLLEGRMLFALKVDGTKTGRLASSESAFWCGTNLQNQPPYAKCIYVAEEGWEYYEYDLSQSEARCVAFLAEDTEFIATIEAPGDFYTKLASKLFGIPYEAVTKVHRNEYTKKIVHGANYNMGEATFIQTFGLKNIAKAKAHLGLANSLDDKGVATHLLNLYHAFAPALRSRWYPSLVAQVVTHGKLVGPTGWTRKFFGDPRDNKRTLNALIAHGPQSLSVMLINKCMLKLWDMEVAGEGKDFRICGQIHDSVLFQVRRGSEAKVLPEVGEHMKIAVTVHGRELKIPVDCKALGNSWGEEK